MLLSTSSTCPCAVCMWFDSHHGSQILSSPERPDRLSAHSAPIYNGYRSHFHPRMAGGREGSGTH
jgi:hypothetical protein